MKSEEEDEVVVAKLEHGDDFFQALEEVVKRHRRGSERDNYFKAEGNKT